MAYPPPQPRRVPVTREEFRSEFTRADGAREARGRRTKWMGPSDQADLDSLIVDEKTELSCGCFWPDTKVGGVCAECVKENENPYVCEKHYVVCACGVPCCWKHSHSVEGSKDRICNRCHIREQNKATKAAVVGALARLARSILFRRAQSASDPE